MISLDSFKSQVVIQSSFPADTFDREKSFLLFDEKLLQENQSFCRDFINSFSHRMGVKAGESLKDFKAFPKHLEALIKKWPQPISRSQSLIVLGGGTLGDFGGFVASILKRGVILEQIPTTWLAAMDSAHGGKNGLNFEGIKNQLGTFYPAKTVYIIKDLLESSPNELKEGSYGELIKMGLIGSSKFFKEMMMEKREANDFIWRFLPFCIEDKYDVVLQDPHERKGIRQVLNFGHTFGHALESHFSWSHGDAVLQGCFFALEWSRHRQLLSDSLHNQILKTIASAFDRVPATGLNWYKAPSAKAMMKALQADKKITGDGELVFVFLKNIGHPQLQPVSVEEVINEAKRQNWVK